MQVDILGIEHVRNRLNAIDQRVSSPRQALESSRRVLSRSIAQNFAEEGRPARWPKRVSNVNGELQYPDTKTHPVLRLTGRLVDSTISESNSGESIAQIDLSARESSLSFGASVPYGKYHNSDAPRRKLPQRKFLLFQDADVDEITDAVRDYCWEGK
jgi:phage gpG-like protein